MTTTCTAPDHIAVEPLRDRDEILAAAADDVYVRSSVPFTPLVGAWAAESGVAWLARSQRRHGAGWLTVTGPPELVPALVRAALDATAPGDVSGATLPAAALPLLAPSMRPAEYNLWDWFWTATAPPVQAGESGIRWAGAADEPAIEAMLDAHSPRHSARPGEPGVLRWCVLEDPASDDLLACAAQVEYVPGVPHLASIVTRGDARGRGLGRAITAWLTRRILDEGGGVVTLGMYADNEPARRVYRRLGYTGSHHWASGRLTAGA